MMHKNINQSFKPIFNSAVNYLHKIKEDLCGFVTMVSLLKNIDSDKCNKSYIDNLENCLNSINDNPFSENLNFPLYSDDKIHNEVKEKEEETVHIPRRRGRTKGCRKNSNSLTNNKEEKNNVPSNNNYENYSLLKIIWDTDESSNLCDNEFVIPASKVFSKERNSDNCLFKYKIPFGIADPKLLLNAEDYDALQYKLKDADFWLKNPNFNVSLGINSTDIDQRFFYVFKKNNTPLCLITNTLYAGKGYFKFNIDKEKDNLQPNELVYTDTFLIAIYPMDIFDTSKPSEPPFCDKVFYFNGLYSEKNIKDVSNPSLKAYKNTFKGLTSFKSFKSKDILNIEFEDKCNSDVISVSDINSTVQDYAHSLVEESARKFKIKSRSLNYDYPCIKSAYHDEDQIYEKKGYDDMNDGCYHKQRQGLSDEYNFEDLNYE